MKHTFEKIAGLFIGLALLAVLVSILMVLFGGSVVGLLTVVFGFPAAFPLTTAVLVILVLGLIVYKRFK